MICDIDRRNEPCLFIRTGTALKEFDTFIKKVHHFRLTAQMASLAEGFFFGGSSVVLVTLVSTGLLSLLLSSA